MITNYFRVTESRSEYVDDNHRRTFVSVLDSFSFDDADEQSTHAAYASAKVLAGYGPERRVTLYRRAGTRGPWDYCATVGTPRSQLSREEVGE
jgi:hypothetical protein